MTCRSPAEGVLVAAVRRGSPAARAGVRVGDRVVGANGASVRDAIDFQFHAGEAEVRLGLEREGRERTIRLVRAGRGGLGIELVAPAPGEIDTCQNRCVFCFIHQLPRGMRRSLYVKDDDYRLSFLHGNYITLTDLDEDALARIEAQRLSPLYVSVHATDPTLRRRLLGNPRGSCDVLPVMRRLARAGIRMHAQIVLCPDWNDGRALAESVAALAGLHPAVATVAIVPVGLTAHRGRLPALRPLTDAEADALVGIVTGWQEVYLRALGSRFVFLGDEVYLQGTCELPTADAYEGFPIAEDGVGLVRQFEDEFRRETRLHSERFRAPATLVTGTLYAPRLTALIQALPAARATVLAVENAFFGGTVGAAGLLTGRDIVRTALEQAPVGYPVLLPGSAVRERDGVFLDDMTPAELGRALERPVRVLAPSAGTLLRALAVN